MKKHITTLLFIIAALIISIQAKASHILGADLYYEHMSGNTYKVSAAFYGDCSGSAFPNLVSSTPEVKIFDGSRFYSTIALNLESPGVEVTPVCPTQKNNTTCASTGGSIPGVTRFIYSNTITLNVASADWRFQLTGEMGTNAQAGRSALISNIIFGSGNASVMVLEAELNNIPGPNSSPRFTTIPTPFYCVNVPQQYNQGSVDANNDSLGFSLANALESGGVLVNYRPGFSPANPIGTAPGNFSFNPVNGQLNFTPDITQNALVVNKVVEYRNGVKVGSASREMTFIVLANCVNNNPPTGTADTTSGNGVGGILVANNTFNVCEGTSLIKFNIKPFDPDGDTIEVVINGLPTGANAIITSNNTPHPLINFSWNTTSLAPGAYNFFVAYKDNGCPISSQQTQAFTINVIRANQLAHKVIYPTECQHKAKVEYDLAYGLLPRTVTIRQGMTTIKTLVDNTGVLSDSLETGTYNYIITSPNLTCPTTGSIAISDSGIYPFPPAFPDVFYCLNDAPVALTATPVTNGNVFWYDSSGTRLSAAPIPSTATTGIFRYMASQLVKVCESRQDTALVYVTKRPIADFVIDPSPVCAQDTATVSFTGAVGVGPILDYKWNWGLINPVSGDSSGPYKVSWYNPGIYTIKLQVFENRCPSDSIEKQVRVKPKPVAAFTLSNTLCQYDSVLVMYATPDSLAGQQYAWDFDGATLSQSTDKGPFKLHWLNSGIKNISLMVSLEGCTDTVSHSTELHNAPEARILNTPGAVCLGDKILLQYVTTGPNNAYTWLSKEKISREADGAPSTRIYTAPTSYTLIVTNEFSCIDSTSITYDKVAPCCQFSYPTAFTPNNDGRNDEFHVVTYGNQEYYDLSIFNRWGQRIFRTTDPKNGWNGNYNEKACEMGVYYYILKAKCLTGYEEEKQGEFTLLR